MSDLESKKVKGVKFIKEGKFEQASKEFKFVIEHITKINNNDQAFLKAYCYVELAKCYIKLNEFTLIIEQSHEFLHFIEEQRNEQWLASKTPEEIKNDSLLKLHESYLFFLGAAFERTGSRANALRTYYASRSEESMKAAGNLLSLLGNPFISKLDSDREIFNSITESIIFYKLMDEAFDKVTRYLEHATPEDIEKLNKTQAIRVVMPVLACYEKDQHAILKCVNLLYEASKRGVYEFWETIDVVAQTTISLSYTKETAESIIQLLDVCPVPFLRGVTSTKNFTDFFSSVFKANEVSSDHIRSAFRIVSTTLFTRYSVDTLKDYFQIAIDMKCKESLFFLSKIAADKDVSTKLLELGYLDQAYELINSDDENDFCTGSQMIYYIADYHKDEIQNPEKLFRAIFAGLMKNKKGFMVVPRGFGALAALIVKCPGVARELKTIPLACVFLSSNIHELPYHRNMISFLIEGCKDQQFLEDCKAYPGLKKNLEKILEKHSDLMTVERAAVLLNLCDHPEKDDLLTKAINRFPDSKELKDLATQQNIV